MKLIIELPHERAEAVTLRQTLLEGGTLSIEMLGQAHIFRVHSATTERYTVEDMIPNGFRLMESFELIEDAFRVPDPDE